LFCFSKNRKPLKKVKPSPMQQINKRVLFISHDASLSGATMVLLALLNRLKANTSMEISVLLNDEGPLTGKFKEVAETYLYHPTPRNYDNRIISFIDRKLIAPAERKNYREKLLQTLRHKNFDLIYNNTIVNGEMLQFLKPLQCRVISHIHELQFVIDCFGRENAELVVANTWHYIAVSQQVKENLTERYKVAPEKISVIPPFIDFDRVDKLKTEVEPLSLRQGLKIPPEAFVVGSAGSVEWRKGPDIFVQVATDVIRQNPNVHFIWAGAEREKNIIYKLEYDAKKAGIEKHVKFLGPRSNPYPYFEMMDLFVLTSREDPYPLVCIESLYLNKPVICFEKSGGAPGLVQKYKAGKTTGYLNVAEMAAEITSCAHAEKSKSLNIDFPQLVKEHSVTTVSQRILEVILNGI
jgi:glycosyltransferase involved in cell wall biosynthesis